MTGALHIVSLADRGVTGKISGKMWQKLAARLRRRVTFEHVCLPPTPVILSDLLFLERFGDRYGAELDAVRETFSRLRRASILLVDDVAEMVIPSAQAYGVLSHAERRDPLTDLITIRRQRYPRTHHLLPTSFVAGTDLPLARASESIAALGAALGTPIYRIATVGAYAHRTAGWDFVDRSTPLGASAGRDVVKAGPFVRALAEWIARLEPVPADAEASDLPLHEVGDLGHYCSHLIDREKLEAVIERYSSFCVVGQESSAPYVAGRIAERGKAVVRASHFTEAALGGTDPNDYEVILSLGPQSALPVVTPRSVISIDTSGQARAPDEPRTYTVEAADMPESARDWHAPFEFTRAANLADRDLFETAMREDSVSDEMLRALRLARRARRARRQGIRPASG